jgi:hypothetical protein
MHHKKKTLQFLACLQEEMIGTFSTKLVLSSIRYRNGLDALVGTGTSPRQESEYTYKVQILLYAYVYSKRKYIRRHKPPFKKLIIICWYLQK